ncbi:hypothetical protein GOP47_0026668 [Adiantum capillus-veneris]|nr:hypothetical protein GOP47_0026668 [Adiantum capillus-veneris]
MRKSDKFINQKSASCISASEFQSLIRDEGGEDKTAHNGAMQDCKCQHCPCLYGESDMHCRICFICEDYAASEGVDEAKAARRDRADMVYGGENGGTQDVTSDATVYASAPLVSMPPAHNMKYTQNYVGSSCCSTNPCCYFQF